MRNRSHHVDVGGLPLRNLLRILERFPNATFRDSTIDVDLGVEVENSVAEPITDAESAVEWGLDRHYEKLLGVDEGVDTLVRALMAHPAILELHAKFKRKRDLNHEAGRAAARCADAEREYLDMLVRSLKGPDGDYHYIDVREDVAEDGGVETESVVLMWMDRIAGAGMNACELSDSTGLTRKQAHDRLVNLWENDYLRCEDEGESRGINGRFFLLEDGVLPARRGRK